MNIAIVGGGATGVELSAELHNAVKQLHSYGYKGLTNEALNVTLVEAGERILPALPPRISAAAHNELTKLGVRVRRKPWSPVLMKAACILKMVNILRLI